MPRGPIIKPPRSSMIRVVAPAKAGPNQPKETNMNYDIQAAQAHFAAKQGFTTGPHELTGMIDRKEDIVIVDLRLPTDYRKGHIPGAINLPKGKWHEASGLAKDKLNVLYCYNQTCHIAAEAALELLKRGYPVAEMEGGFATWEANSYPIATAAPKAA
jgi:rhodanese-related sulfurtransferase